MTKSTKVCGGGNCQIEPESAVYESSVDSNASAKAGNPCYAIAKDVPGEYDTAVSAWVCGCVGA